MGQTPLNSPLPHRDPQHFPGPGHFRPPAKHSKGLVCKSPLGDTSPGKTFQNNPKPFCWKLPERDEGRTAVPICLGAYLESSCHTQALRHTHRSNYGGQLFSFEEKHVLDLRNLSLSETDLRSNPDASQNSSQSLALPQAPTRLHCVLHSKVFFAC